MSDIAVEGVRRPVRDRSPRSRAVLPIPWASYVQCITRRSPACSGGCGDRDQGPCSSIEDSEHSVFMSGVSVHHQGLRSTASPVRSPQARSIGGPGAMSMIVLSGSAPITPPNSITRSSSPKTGCRVPGYGRQPPRGVTETARLRVATAAPARQSERCRDPSRPRNARNVEFPSPPCRRSIQRSAAYNRHTVPRKAIAMPTEQDHDVCSQVAFEVLCVCAVSLPEGVIHLVGFRSRPNDAICWLTPHNHRGRNSAVIAHTLWRCVVSV